MNQNETIPYTNIMSVMITSAYEWSEYLYVYILYATECVVRLA